VRDRTGVVVFLLAALLAGSAYFLDSRRPVGTTAPAPAKIVTQEQPTSLGQLIGELMAPSPAIRKRAARAIAASCQRDDCDVASIESALEALKARQGPNREPDESVFQVVFDAAFEVGAARARRVGLRVPKPANAESLKDAELGSLVIANVWDAASIYHGRKRLRAVLDLATPGEVALFAIFWTKDEIDNGGFHQYFYNSTGVLSPEAAPAYRLVGAPEFAELHARAERLFPAGAPPLEVGARRRALDSLDKARFDALSDEFYKLDKNDRLNRLCAAYVRTHPAEFFLPP
jgi:hypothetical protein